MRFLKLDPYSNILFLKKLPSFKNSFVICDRKLKLKIKNRSQNKNIYFVKGGESLKDIEQFSLHTKKIVKRVLAMPQPPLFFMGVGGGSVTDFTGFFASIYKRGTPVNYTPTTLLSAIDAVHGGKTALNVSSVKNVLGSYHFPKKIFIVKNLLQQAGMSEISSAYGELIKIALIGNVSLYKKLKKKTQPSFENIWGLMLPAVKLKWDIVSKDPYEKKNIRRSLNLGHTLGHCFESCRKIPHGKAVAMGVLFSLRWSAEKKYISSSLFLEAQSIIEHYTEVSSLPKIPLSQLKKLLDQDKKRISSNKIEFIFIKGLGRPFIKSVSIDGILKFYKKHYL